MQSLKHTNRKKRVRKKIYVIALVHYMHSQEYSTVINLGVVAQNWITDGTVPRIPQILARFRFITRFVVLFSFYLSHSIIPHKISLKILILALNTFH